MTQNQIITVIARKNMVRARAGEIQLPKIVGDRKSTRLNSSHSDRSRMPSSA